MNKREYYLDLLRILSIFSVIVVHVSSFSWNTLSIYGLEWQMKTVYDGLVRFCVPIFIMVSGYLFLNSEKKLPIQVLFKKYIFRIVKIFLFWSVVYGIVYTIFQYKKQPINLFSYFIKESFLTQNHLWFLLMLLGLYLIVPFLKTIVVEKKLVEYFLVLSFIFAVLIPTLVQFDIFSPVLIINNKINLYFVLGYPFYFLLGHYVGTYNIPKKKFIYALGILGTFITISGTFILSFYQKKPTSILFNYLTTNVFVQSMALFLSFKNKFFAYNFTEAMKEKLVILSNYSFGVYLIHFFFVILFSKITLLYSLLGPFLYVPVVSVVIMLLSYVAISIMAKFKLFKPFIL
ncbi:acyltransferase [Carnobacterium maltaromaticum]